MSTRWLSVTVIGAGLIAWSAWCLHGAGDPLRPGPGSGTEGGRATRAPEAPRLASSPASSPAGTRETRARSRAPGSGEDAGLAARGDGPAGTGDAILARRLLTSTDPEAASEVVALLALRPRGLARLRAALEDPSVASRLGRLAFPSDAGADTARVDALADAARDDDPRVAALALRALAACGPAALRATPALLAALDAGGPEARALAAEALAEVDVGPAAAPALSRAAATDDDPAVRRAAASALGALRADGPAVVATLARALLDGDAGVRAAAARALGRLGPAAASAGPALERAASDADPLVRSLASGALDAVRAP